MIEEKAKSEEHIKTRFQKKALNFNGKGYQRACFFFLAGKVGAHT
jgi:hypothetical protein